MQHDEKATHLAEGRPALSSPPPGVEAQVCPARRAARLRLRLHAVWEAGRCALDAEPGVLTEAREAELGDSYRPGAEAAPGFFLDALDRPALPRLPFSAADPELFWRRVWEAALAALAGRRPGADSTPASSVPEPSTIREDIVDVYLPFLTRNEWKLGLPAGAFEIEVDEFLRVNVLLAESAAARWERVNFQQTALLLAGALPRPAGPAQPAPALRFADGRRLIGPQLRYSLPRLLAACGFLAPQLAHALESGELAEEAEVSIALSLPSPDAVPFFEAPRQRSPQYYEAFGQVSLAIQQALRAWLPYMFFADLDRYGDPEVAYPMLAYQASRPFSRKGSPEFTYDVMNPESVRRALRSAGPPLAELLETASALLAASGRETEAHRYRRLEPKTLVETVRRAPKAFQGLLAAEACFVGEVIKLALEARLLREEPAEAPRRLYRLVSQFTEGIHQRLRRLYRGLSPVSLGSLLLIETSRALSLAHGIPSPLVAAVRLRTASGKQVECTVLRDKASQAGPDAGRL